MKTKECFAAKMWVINEVYLVSEQHGILLPWYKWNNAFQFVPSMIVMALCQVVLCLCIIHHIHGTYFATCQVISLFNPPQQRYGMVYSQW